MQQLPPFSKLLGLTALAVLANTVRTLAGATALGMIAFGIAQLGYLISHGAFFTGHLLEVLLFCWVLGAFIAVYTAVNLFGSLIATWRQLKAVETAAGAVARAKAVLDNFSKTYDKEAQ